MRSALRLSRLEIRRDGPMRGPAVGTGVDGVSRENRFTLLSAGGTRWGALDVYGVAGESAGIAGIRIRAGAAGTKLRVQTVAVLQLVAGAGGWDRFQPCVMAASGGTAVGSVDDGVARE